MEFINAIVENEAYYPFVFALLLLCVIGILEVLFGFLPDIDLDLDADVELGMGTYALDWLHIGRLPVIVVLVICLMFFSIIGITTQTIIIHYSGTSQVWLVSLFSLLTTLCILHFFGGWLTELFPKDSSVAVSADTFIGKIATIVMGEATTDTYAQARLEDDQGKDHHVLVKPDNKTHTYKEGQRVVLVEREDDGSTNFICVLMEEL